MGIALSNTRGIGPGGAGETGRRPGAIISSNTLTGDTTNDSIGIWLRGPSDGVQITNNIVNGVNKGVKLDRL